MPDFDLPLQAYQVVRVPFPFTDRQAERNRPALVLSDAALFNAPVGHAVLAMITSAGNPPWPFDCAIADLDAAGLPAPSKVRFKLFTLEARLARGVLGRLSEADAAGVERALARLLGMPGTGSMRSAPARAATAE